MPSKNPYRSLETRIADAQRRRYELLRALDQEPNPATRTDLQGRLNDVNGELARLMRVKT